MKTYRFSIKNKKYEARVVESTSEKLLINLNGTDYEVVLEDEDRKKAPEKEIRLEVSAPVASAAPKHASSLPGGVTSPLPGVVKAVFIKEGDLVEEGDKMLILEAMKMESEIPAPFKGIVKKVPVAVNSSVVEGELLVEIGER